ncbi:MAG: NF038122 family metalloprotease [Janthinobacterium lividum]
MKILSLAASLTTFVSLAAFSAPSNALTFSFSQVPGDSLSVAQADAFQTAANIWSASLSDAITVNLQIGFASLPANVLGSTTPTILYSSGTDFRTTMTNDARSATDAQAVASLAGNSPSTIALASAEAKALGYNLPAGFSSDGKIEFSSSFTFSTARNPNGTIAAGTYDLVGIAEHEIGHILGFVSSVDGFGNGYQTVLDQFRYTAPQVRSATAGAAAYFSVDGGLTKLASFSTGTPNQASHWLIGTGGVMVPEVAAGTTQNLTALDLQAFDAIGYDVRVPEPWSISLLALGSLAAIRLRRRT